ncbi:polyprenyl synthetase family protein [Streptomyces coffeae]|uniref:Polyprenyl synthetase family protein n=1 Tax=Streptomyces coffeae TaxID=621382 RepID=A0ABS1NDC9_9ACTN|nr:polyprenyl synthetase family protein [Streptomyces coffeae]MBL1098089.1 polyprenyl synthetase family protein [Streptomyces coffeae]
MVASFAHTVRSGFLAGELAAREPALTVRLQRGLGVAEERLRGFAAEAEDPYVARIVGHLIGTGGKRLRPLLALVGAEFGERDPGIAVDTAALAELVHVASLYHDDVMDQARTRRGAPSANAMWGNSVAVLAGNWLLAKAARVAAELGPEILQLQARVTNRLVTGQIRELTGASAGEDALSHYFAVVAGKSASLIAMALQSGAIRTGTPETTVQALAAYGEHLGTAFQIADDILDITAASEVSGKEQGKDLAVGVASLPVLLALANEGPEAEELRELLTAAGRGREGAAVVPRAVALLRDGGALAEAEAMMRTRMLRARSALDGLPEGAATRMLYALCDVVADRDH